MKKGAGLLRNTTGNPDSTLGLEPGFDECANQHSMGQTTRYITSIYPRYGRSSVGLRALCSCAVLEPATRAWEQFGFDKTPVPGLKIETEWFILLGGFYVAAQGLERLMEPLSSLMDVGSAKADTKAAEDAKKVAEERTTTPPRMLRSGCSP